MSETTRELVDRVLTTLRWQTAEIYRLRQWVAFWRTTAIVGAAGIAVHVLLGTSTAVLLGGISFAVLLALFDAYLARRPAD